MVFTFSGMPLPLTLLLKNENSGMLSIWGALEIDVTKKMPKHSDKWRKISGSIRVSALLSQVSFHTLAIMS